MEDPLLSVQRSALDELAASGILHDSILLVDTGAATCLESIGGLPLLLNYGKRNAESCHGPPLTG